MSKRNETVNRIYQGAKSLRTQLSTPAKRRLRAAIEDAYDAGKAHGAQAEAAEWAAEFGVDE